MKIKEGIAAVDKSRLKDLKKSRLFLIKSPLLLCFHSKVSFSQVKQRKKSPLKDECQKVKLKISKIYPNNITAYLHKQNLIGSTKYADNTELRHGVDYEDYGIYADFERLGDVVLEKDFTLDMQKNQWIQTQLDFSSLKASEGIFILELSFDKDGVDYDFPQDTADWRKEQFFNKFGRF